MSAWPAVHGYGSDKLEPDVMNRPIQELALRTDILKGALDASLADEGLSRIVGVFTMSALPHERPEIPCAVFYDRVRGVLVKAVNRVTGIAVEASGDLCTVVLAGKTALPIPGSEGMLAGSEEFAPGPYYLSMSEPGMMTASAGSAAVYLGEFSAFECTVSPSPTESHRHEAVQLYARPAGESIVEGYPVNPLPTSTMGVLGYAPDGEAQSGEPASLFPRLVLRGSYTAGEPCQCTVWLADSALSTDPVTAVCPVSWDSAYAVFKYSFATREELEAVRVCSYDDLYSAPYGMSFVITRSVDASADIAVDALPDEEEEDYDKRMWSLDLPLDGQGWRRRLVHARALPAPGSTSEYELVVSGPLTAENGVSGAITVRVATGHPLSFNANPADGEEVAVDGMRFIFYLSDIPAEGIPVPIAAEKEDTVKALVAAIRGNRREAAFLDASMFIFSADVTTDAADAVLSAYQTGGTDMSTAVHVVVHDETGLALTGTVTVQTAFWDEIAAAGGTIMPVPYSGTTPAAGTTGLNDAWTVGYEDRTGGCRFEYASGYHDYFSSVWPSNPLSAAALSVNGVYIDKFDTLADYVPGHSTIHWRHNAYGYVPWSSDWTRMNGSESRTTLVVDIVASGSGQTVGSVTSLSSAPGSPVRVVRCGTDEPATSGDLALALDMNMAVVQSNRPGYHAVKGSAGGALIAGPVVERIAVDGSLSMTSAAGAPRGQGIVTLSSVAGKFTGEFDTIALENAKQAVVGMFPYIKLLGWTTGGAGNIPTAFTSMFRVPHDVTGRYRVLVHATVFGETGIPWVSGGYPLFAGVSFEYSILPDYRNIGDNDGNEWSATNSFTGTLQDGLLTPEAATVAEIPFGKYDAGDPSKPIYRPFDPMLIHNDPSLADEAGKCARVLGSPLPVPGQFPLWTIGHDPHVTGGSLVGIRISRRGVTIPSREYTAPIGFIGLRWTLVTEV